MLLRDIALRGKGIAYWTMPTSSSFRSSTPMAMSGDQSTAAPTSVVRASRGGAQTRKNLNLNRDYLKSDSPEMRAMIGLIRRFDPVLYVDLHVTDGTDYQYDITYAFPGWRGYYAKSEAIGRWLDRRLRPQIDAALTRNGHIPGNYVSAVDNRNP